MIEDDEPFALTGVVAEVLQGLTKDAAAIEQYLAQWDMIEPCGFEAYREAARIYRAGRAKGIWCFRLALGQPRSRNQGQWVRAIALDAVRAQWAREQKGDGANRK
jgi:hypothetical protein